MEREALLLRLRAEHAKLKALYADAAQRVIYEQQMQAWEAQATELENRLDLWPIGAAGLAGPSDLPNPA